MDKEELHKLIESYEELEEEEDLEEEPIDIDLDFDDDEDQDHLKFQFEKQDDDEQDDQDDDDDDDYDYDDDNDDEDADEVDEKVARLLPKATMIDVCSGKTVDGVEVRSNKRKRDEEEEEEVELELDDENDDDFEQVEEMTFPSVIKKIENGKTVYEMEVPVMKDDDFIDDSMYRDDFEPTDTKKDFAEALYFRPPKIQAKAPDVCPICFKHWTSDDKHRVCCLPCGHIFGASCIKKWLQTDLCSKKKCPQCNIYCTLEDVIPLNATSFRIPAADKGADDQKTSTRRFPLCNRGLIAFHNFEIARRNFALKKWSDAKQRLAGVLWRENEAMKRRTDLLDRMKALEQQGVSLCQADALGTLADEYVRRAEACEGKAKALRQRAKAYNERFNAFEPRLFYFIRCVEDVFKLR